MSDKCLQEGIRIISTQAFCKKGNLERHYNTNHPKFDESYPPKSSLRAKKVAELAKELRAQQQLFTRPVDHNKAATEASFRVSHLLAQHKKPFTDGELVKQAMTVTADTLFAGYKNKDEIAAAVSRVPLGPPTVTRRFEELSRDVDKQVLEDLKQCKHFSLQFDESVDIVDTAQLAIFVRMSFKDSTTKEDFLTLLHLKEKTRGQDMYEQFKQYVRENNIPIQKLAAMTTDGAPAMIVVNSIRAHALQHRLFKALLEELEAAGGDLLLHANVRWLSRGKVLQRFVDLLPEIRQFLSTRKDGDYPELSNDEWLLDLGFIIDLTAKLNALNCDMQGRERDLSHMLSSVNSFKAKIGLWKSQLQSRRLAHFSNLEKMLQCVSDREAFQPERYGVHLDNLADDFNSRFKELDEMESIICFISNPFLPINVEQVAEKFVEVFSLPAGVDMEIVELQNDIALKARYRDSDFWGLVNSDTFPLLSSCALKVRACFGSTYLCEMAFSQMKLIKSKHRSRLTDSHLTDCMRLAMSSYEPNFKALAESYQAQPSH
ncbi:SCAN domain-containing protein 3-like [Diretmus argenteus]